MLNNARRAALVCFVGAMMFFLLIIPCLAQDAQQYYQQGLAAYQGGKWELAVAALEGSCLLGPEIGQDPQGPGVGIPPAGFGRLMISKKSGEIASWQLKSLKRPSPSIPNTPRPTATWEGHMNASATTTRPSRVMKRLYP